MFLPQLVAPFLIAMADGLGAVIVCMGLGASVRLRVAPNECAMCVMFTSCAAGL